MLKKMIAMTVITALSISALAACTQKQGNSTETKTNPGSAEQKKIEKVVIYQNTGKIASSGKAGSNPEDFEAVKKYIIEKAGIEPVVIVPPKGSEADKLNMLLASGEPLDIFWDQWTKMSATGAIQPINELLDKYGQDAKKAWPQEAWDGMTDKNKKIWGVPRGVPTVAYPVYVREDWVKKLGLKMPATIDELENVLKVFLEKDPAGNGQTIPMAADLKSLNRVLAAGYMETGYGNFLDKDGKLKPSEFHPGYKEFITRMADWYKKGYIYKESFTVKDERIRELLKQNKIGSTAKWYSIVTLQEGYLKENFPDANYEIARGIKGPKGISETTNVSNAQGALINKKAPNPVAAMKLLNWEYQDIEHNITATFGIKGKNWEYKDEKNKVISTLNDNYIGEFVTGLGLANERQFSFADPIKKKHYDYIGKFIFDFDRAKKAVDAEIVYDVKTISDKVPTKGDVDRMVSEEITKFIMGARPMSEYDQFLNEWLKVGADKLIEAQTEIYNQMKKK